LPETHVEPVVVSEREMQTLEASLEKLWEKARRVSDLLLRFKEENRVLKNRVKELEQLEVQLRSNLQERERELERVRAEVIRLQSNGSQMFTQEEKEVLRQRIKDLIGKINMRL
jgi:septal ring factor EnvC (AmiA/AmiB activator)